MIEARHQINEALLSYCRGIDRLRADDVRAGFHPGAMLHGYGGEPTPIEDFADYAVVALADRFEATQHRISNTRIEFNEDALHATVETYVHATHLQATEDGLRLHTFAGRYIDECSPVAGVWKINKRTLRNDWSKIEPIDEPMRGAWMASGRGDQPDPLFES